MKSSLKSSLGRSDSITSENELLTMSYARGSSAGASGRIADESCTEEEKAQIASLPASTFSSFVSPAERKRRQLAKLEAMKKEQEADGQAAVIDAEVSAVEPPAVSLNDLNDDDSSESSSASSSSDTTGIMSNVNPSSPKSGGSNEDENLGGVPDSETTQVTPAGDKATATSASEDEDISEIPLESDAQKLKRVAIKEVMNDSSLSQVERNKKIQGIIAGEVSLGNVDVALPPQAPPDSGKQVESVAISTFDRGVNETVTPETEHISEMPLESDIQKRKRVAIKEVVSDSSLSQTEKTKKIQDIIGGKVDLSHVEVEPSDASVEVGLKETTLVKATSDEETESRCAEVEKKPQAQDVTTEAKASPESADADMSNQPASMMARDDEPLVTQAASITDNTKVQPAVAPSDYASDDLDLNYRRNLQRGLELKAQQQQRENQAPASTIQADSQIKSSNVTFAVAMPYESQPDAQKQSELKIQLEQQRKEMEMQLEMQRKSLEMEKQRRLREFEIQQQLELEMVRQHRLEMEQQQREMEFQVEQRRLREEAENRRQAERHRLELERMRDLERQQSVRQMRQERERQIQEELDRQRQSDMSCAAIASYDNVSNLSAVAAAKTLMSRMNFFRPPRTNQPRSSRYDGVGDEELNWRLDCYASLSDFTIVVHRALPGPFAPDFDVADINLIDASLGTDGSPIVDVYYVHRVMLAVGGARSELLGRRIRDAEVIAENSMDGSSVGDNIHETILLESAAESIPIVLDFCYFPDRPIDITVNNAVPLVYLANRYKIRALLEKTEAFLEKNLESANSVHFLLDAYLYKLDEILRRAIDVTAAHFDDRIDFQPIYELPSQLFRRIIASTSLKCDSELLSLVVYSYCGEHHPDEIDVEYFREVTRPKLMPDIDSKVALMILKFYVDLLEEEEPDRDVMELLQDDNLTNRCITVIAKNWREEICEPLMIDAEWDETAAASRRNLPPHEPASLHRSLPSQLQNRILERCLLVAMDVSQSEKEKATAQATAEKEAAPLTSETPIGKDNKDDNNIALNETQKRLTSENDQVQKELNELRAKAAELELELKKKSKAIEQYQQELKLFRRVPGIHNFGTISKKDPKLIDKTLCTYSANPDHHFPNHRRGNKPPTHMPQLASEFDNLGKQNGYVYNDGHGELLPVFYYSGGR